MIPVSIRHDQYEKLVDEVYYLGGNVILKMNVVLNRRKEDGTSFNYHNEYMYDSEKYTNHNKLITMKRCFDYFLTLENAKQYDVEKESIMIRPQDYYNIQYNLSAIQKWFEIQDMYAVKDNKLYLINPPNPITISNLAGGKKILIEATVISYENIQYEGVRIYLNNTNNYADITMDRLMGFIYIMNTIDMYGAAQHMVSYHGRPPSGDNIVVFGDPNMEAVENGSVGGVNNRVILNKKRKSFFDDIDKM